MGGDEYVQAFAQYVDEKGLQAQRGGSAALSRPTDENLLCVQFEITVYRDCLRIGREIRRRNLRSVPESRTGDSRCRPVRRNNLQPAIRTALTLQPTHSLFCRSLGTGTPRKEERYGSPGKNCFHSAAVRLRPAVLRQARPIHQVSYRKGVTAGLRKTKDGERSRWACTPTARLANSPSAPLPSPLAGEMSFS